MKNEVTVVDHGLCNLFNLVCALEEVGASVIVTRDAGQIAQASRLILPGVGAFEPAMDSLRELGLEAGIKAHTEAGKPLLGICLGMQLLMGFSQENGQHTGLGLIGGGATRFKASQDGTQVFKVPLISWNTLHTNAALPGRSTDPVLQDVPDGSAFYFVHSYYVMTDDAAHTLAWSEYAGVRYAAMVRRANVWGAQFHPERSAAHGLQILANFSRLPLA